MIIFPLLLSAQLMLVSDAVPQFDVNPACRAAGVGELLNRSVEACSTDEDNAKKTLAHGWSKFPVADRAECQRMVTMGGPASYVELLTCLELAQQSRGTRNAAGPAGPL